MQTTGRVDEQELRAALLGTLEHLKAHARRIGPAGARDHLDPRTLRLRELWSGALLRLGLTGGDLAIVGIGTLILLAVEVWQEYRGPVRPALAKQRGAVQWLAMLLPMAALLLLGILRGSYIASEFIYRQY